MNKKNKLPKGPPPRFILIDLLARAGMILSGIGCGELDVNDDKVKSDIGETTNKIMIILNMVRNNPNTEAQFEEEREALMDDVLKDLNPEEAESLLQEYEEYCKENDIKSDSEHIRAYMANKTGGAEA